MVVKQLMIEKLTDAFAPHMLSVTDVSYQHAGHAGAPAGGESHFELEIGAACFEGQSRLACHRMINQALAELLAGPVHALQIKIVKNS